MNEYTCPYCKRKWRDRSNRESYVCPGCGAGPEEYAKTLLTRESVVADSIEQIKESFGFDWPAPRNHGFKSELSYWIHQASLK